MDGPSLYDTDILAWSEQQAAALRRLAARAERANDIDFENVVEEIESVGRSQLNSVESRIRLILAHLIKAISDPEAPALPHWRTEWAVWQGDLVQMIAPSMHQRLDLDRIWRRSMHEARLALAEHDGTLADLPETCPVTLDDLLVDGFDLPPLGDRLRRSPRP